MSVLAAFAVPHPPIILPEIGRGEENRIQQTIDAYREVMRRAAGLRPDTVVVTSPHATLYADYFHISPGASARGDLASFGFPGVHVRADYDEDFVKALSLCADEAGVPAGTLGERAASVDHGTLIPLRFLNEAYGGYRVVRIGLSGLPPLLHHRLGECIARTADRLGRRTVLLASGDLSHRLAREGPYGFAPEGPVFDRQVTAALAAADFSALLRLAPELSEKAGECGLRSFQIMAGALDGKAVKSELLSYEGPFGVGYGVASFLVTGRDESRRFAMALEHEEQERLEVRKANEDPYVRLARMSLEAYVTTGRRAQLPDGLPDEMLHSRAGTFVSLKKNGQLRGCIGTIAPTTGCVAREILQNAVSAGTADPRFSPVTSAELKELVYSVDVLGEAEPAASPEALDPMRYGVIVQSGTRRGLLLPNLEGVDTAEEQIDIAREKAGIGRHEPAELFRFEVVRHT